MTKAEKHQDIHSEAMRNFDKCQSALYSERKQCLEDRRFYSIAGAQWEGSLAEQFENKPKYEINKIHLSVMRIINEYRNNRISVDFVSKDGTNDNDLSDVCDGLFRADERDSGAEEAYDNAFEEAVGGGFGALRIGNKYEDEEDDDNENQRIRIEPIYDADSSVFFDIGAKRQDKADSKYCFVMYAISPEDFEEEYGKSPTTIGKEITQIEYDWYTPDIVYVAEYYRVEEKRETIRIFRTITGEEERYSQDDFDDNPELMEELSAVGSKEIRQKKVKKHKVRKYILSGNEILEDCGYIAGKNIPIIPAYGKRWYVDSIERCMGHVRLVKDVQRIKNMLTSKLAEISALSTVEKPIFTPEQVVGLEERWASDNIKDYPYQLVHPITDAAGNQLPAGPIGYTKPPQIPPALAALLQLVDIDMKDILGNPGEGEKIVSNISGKAIEMIQKKIDGQAFIYMSNFAKTIRRVGEIWLSMAKDVYVEKGRMMKTIGTMGETGTVELQKPIITDKGKNVYENDITEATFDVAVDVGPSSTTQREATVKSLTGMMQMTTDPETAQVLQAMAMMNMEGDGIAEVREYFRKKLVSMGVIKPTEEEAEMMAAQAEETNAQDKALNAMAEEAEANAAKARVSTLESMSKTELNQAKTAEVYSDIEIEQAKAVLDMLQN